jgi:hypothetical protein
LERGLELDVLIRNTDAPIITKKKDGKTGKSEEEWMDVDDIE